jgi:serine protease AprX
MKNVPRSTEGVRSSALWGKRSSGERSSALWGKGGRGFVAFVALVAVLVVPTTGIAAQGSGKATAVVPADLLAAAKANPNQVFNVIVQGKRGQVSSKVADGVRSNNGKVKKTFRSIVGAAAQVSGKTLLKLAGRGDVLAITRDTRVVPLEYQNAEMWRESTKVDTLWTGGVLNALTGLLAPAPQAPAIAIVDSGVQADNLAFGDRVVASVNLSSLAPGATGDDQGHGTMVAGVAAGAIDGLPGVAQNAPIVSVRTSDANGQSMTSDVIAAADWILANKGQYNIRVANFSLGSATQTTFRFDPLDEAVERLWFNGVVVVAAAGNHGTGEGPVDMSYAPANDPFVITVGALDQVQTSDPTDDTAAWWSAYGYTIDGFFKPEVAAPGRYMIMPVPESASIPASFPDRVIAPGFIWMSGTSFSAPVVAGAAAQLLARHPDWTPDQVKGALMLTTVYLGESSGVGEIDAAAAAGVTDPPNPNENLNAFVEIDSTTGQRVFNEASWARHVDEVTASGASWAAASWASASWARASWARASWTTASWARASWARNVDTLMTSTATENESSRSLSAGIE